MGTQVDIICLSPPGFPGISLVAAGRGGTFRGGIGLEFARGDVARRCVEDACKTGLSFTISIAHRTEGLTEIATAGKQRGLECIILCTPDPGRLASDIRTFHALGLRILVEATEVDHAEAAERAGADGIVVKGNECGGRVGEETSFILLQRVASRISLPIWVRGGVGLCTGAACVVGGATGVVLDWQLALCEESGLPDDVKARISRMDGSETAILGQGCRDRYRAFVRAGESTFAKLRDLEEKLSLDGHSNEATLARWREEVEASIGGDDGRQRLLAMGQDAAFAAGLARQFKSADGICEAVRQRAAKLSRAAARHRALRPDGPLARSHGTRFPILQGPMTRVSDTADFAKAVADGGGLPFLALALLRGPQVDKLLDETKVKLAGHPWGVGILGFVPKELRDEQLAEVRKHPPPFAIIAGGRPDQALELEREGIATYLHVPSPGLLNMFLKSGARRVIFEGRECGGHVGPRTSFVLWESMIEVILDHLKESGDRGDAYHVVFAGGIHDGRSASMVAALAAPLSELGVRVGVLLGTSYLFTKDAVEAGAIVPGFQSAALRCRQTILLESGVGHATRCADTDFGELFETEKRRLIREGRSRDEIREALERLNLGRLRIASKGITRGKSDDGLDGAAAYTKVDEAAQQRDGMYMIGQVAALREHVCTIEELHADVSVGGTERLRAFATAPASQRPRRAEGPSDVAIVGISCLLPKAADKGQFWENILDRVRATGEIPPDRWNWELYFNSDRRLRDNCYSKWGGFIDPVKFDPMRYGMPPNSIPSVEPLQLLVLEAVRAAIEDAGYSNRPFDREHTSVILGAGGGVGEHGLGYGFRSMAMHYLTAANASADEVRELIERLGSRIPEWTEDSFAGLLMNVAAGRVANRFDLGGSNYTVDAACASSLAAVRLAVDELEFGSSNMVIVGGADTMQSPFAYLCFSNTQALSPTGQARPFDASADGIVISEGIAMAVLKRVEDAVRDGDRVYAVIKGVGSSSDGKDKGLTAPRPAGQIRALERAYDKAGFTPDTVSLIEAHGTGTVVGDQSEVESLTRMFTAAGAGRQDCALGSVKSMIGHTKCTAGVAGLIKAALALHHKVLPPTIGVTQPNPKADFNQSPFYVNVEAKPWARRVDGAPRRAGVSAFGFGGTNFHAALEEFIPEDGVSSPDAPGRHQWPAELFIWRAQSTNEIVRSFDSLLAAIAQGAQPLARDLAAALWTRYGRAANDDGACTLAVVAKSLDDLVEKIQSAREKLVGRTKQLADPSGVYFGGDLRVKNGKVALLFPGQGSQSVNMLRDLAIAMPGIRGVFEEADQALGNTLGQALSSFVFPRPSFSDEMRVADEAALTQTRVAQPAMGAADAALFRLLTSLGLRGEMLGGHSYGEYVALHGAGVIRFEDLIRISELRGRLIGETAGTSPGAMAAVSADGSTAKEIIKDMESVWLANLNAPNQTVISGTEQGINAVLAACKEKGLAARRIKVSCAFHSPLVEPAAVRFGKVLDGTEFLRPSATVFSNSTARPYECDPEAIKRQLVDHLVRPVRFADEVRGMYDAGARVFVEVGPGRTLTGLVEQILKGESVVAVAMNPTGRDGISALLLGLAQLAAAGCRLDANPLFEGRMINVLNLDKLVEQTKPAPPARTTWLISGAKAAPLNGQGEAPSSKRDRADSPVLSRSAAEACADGSPTGSLDALGSTVAAFGSSQRDSSIQRLPTHNEPHVRRDNPHSVDPRSPLPSEAIARSGSDTAVLLSAHQQLMTKFLDTHKRVMLGLLAGGDSGVAPQNESALMAEEPISSADMQLADSGAFRSAGPQKVNGVGALQPSNAWAIESASPHPVRPPLVETTTEMADSASALVAQPVEKAVAPVHERLIALLVDIVADRTGYPPEMLGLDLDLEADLGIDSIKRVEILGALQEHSTLAGGGDSADMETLARLKTLRAIVDWLADRIPGDNAAVATVDEKFGGSMGRASHTTAEPAAKERPAPRMTLRAVDCPIHSSDSLVRLDGAVVIIDDELGVASSVTHALQGRGMTVELVRAARGSQSNGLHPRVDLADPVTTREWVNKVRKQHGRIAAILDLLPLGNASLCGGDFEEWMSPLNTELLGLFNLVQASEEDLRKHKGGRVLAFTRMGGDFGSLSKSHGLEFWPGSGGVCGLVKTLAREWPEVVSRVVDFPSDYSTAKIAELAAAELLANDPVPEVGYLEGKRIALLPTAASFSDRPAAIALDRDSVVLITGGARGITAECAIELARRFQCRLMLVGRSSLPPGEEDAETAGITDAKQIKSVLLQRLRHTEDRVTPAQVEAAFGRLMRERETRSNLATMRAAGATVEYHAVDVADRAAFGALIDDLYQRLGRIDGVVHGAGVIEDKLIRDKTPESFHRVFDPKVVGALVLASKLRGEFLKFLTFFSSVSGRYGNKGQCDYAAANEVISKLAIRLNTQWPAARVASLMWGPWESSGGMVSAELAKQFAKAGIHILSRSEGRRALLDEISFGRKEDAEVVFGGPLNISLPGGDDARSARAAQVTDDQPLLKVRASISRHADGSVEVIRELDPQTDLYLIDHQLDGRPVMPMAMVLELFAESASLVCPDRMVRAVHDLRVLRGISFERGSQTARIIASSPIEGRGEWRVLMRAEIGEHRHLHDTAEVEIGTALPIAPTYSALQLTNPRRLPITVSEAYEQWLFHGPLFAGIAEVEALGDNGIIATLSPSTPKRCLAESPKGHWLIDPVMVDSALQLIILWARTYLDMTPLPARLTCYHRYAGPVSGPVRCEASVKHVPGTPVIHADFRFMDESGRLVGWLEGLEGTCSKALNRLAATRTSHAVDSN